MPELSPKKVLLAKIFAKTGLNSILASARRGLLGNHARAVNYHDVSSTMLNSFEEQLRFYRAHYVNIGRSELGMLLEGTWKSDRPGLLITFDDGLRSHADHVAPLLEKYGFSGWFFVPSQFVDTPVEEQWAFANEHAIRPFEDDFVGERIALSWDQVRDLDSCGHVIGCHTWHHTRLEAKLDQEQLDREIIQSKAKLEDELGHEVDVFCWVGGEEWSYSGSAAAAIRRADYRLSFMTNNLPILPGSNPLQIQRTNIEAWNPAEIVAFQLNGVLDIVYTAKRRRVNRLTADPGSS